MIRISFANFFTVGLIALITVVAVNFLLGLAKINYKV